MNASKPEADKDMEKKKFLTKWLHAISLEISSNPHFILLATSVSFLPFLFSV